MSHAIMRSGFVGSNHSAGPGVKPASALRHRRSQSREKEGIMPQSKKKTSQPHPHNTPQATQGTNREPANKDAGDQQHPMAPRARDLPDPEDIKAASEEAQSLQHPDEPQKDKLAPRTGSHRRAKE
jgi:hypothetical protein